MRAVLDGLHTHGIRAPIMIAGDDAPGARAVAAALARAEVGIAVNDTDLTRQ